VKAKVPASHTKQMVLGFFVRKESVYMHVISRGITINANYTMAALGKFLKHGAAGMVPTLGQYAWPPAALVKN
jgi:hypothetical protein